MMAAVVGSGELSRCGERKQVLDRDGGHVAGHYDCPVHFVKDLNTTCQRSSHSLLPIGIPDNQRSA